MKKRWKRLISILLMCCMVVGLLPTTSLAITTESPDVAILSGAAKYDEENGYWVLTPDYTMESSGAMWLTSLVEGDFTLDLEYYTGSSDRPLGGADGITVAFWAEYGYTLPNGADMGFTGSQGYGIELDTYYSGNKLICWKYVCKMGYNGTNICADVYVIRLFTSINSNSI